MSSKEARLERIIELDEFYRERLDQELRHIRNIRELSIETQHTITYISQRSFWTGILVGASLALGGCLFATFL